MKALIIIAVLSCPDTAVQRYRECIDFCMAYPTPQAHAACVKRCRQELREDTESCLLED